jgi:phenylacetic acid degradation operon negative regulatory protein
VWMRPANLAVQLPAPVHGDIELMTARPEDPVALTHRLWDLPAWSARALGLLVDLQVLTPDAPEALAPGFELSAAVLRHLQADPLLPASLLPVDWPGAHLRATYEQWDARYRTTLRQWSRAA